MKTLFIFCFIPLLNILMGSMKPKKEINGTVGYRTAITKSSQELWDYGQLLMKKYMLRTGLIMLVLGIAGFVVYNFLSQEVGGVVLTVVMFVQVFSIFVTNILLNKAMKKKLEENNER